MANPRARANQKPIPDWAEALRVRRVQLGLSQEDLAARTDDLVSQRTVSALETGATPLDKMAIARVVSLANALDWSIRQMQDATGIDLGAAIPTEWVQAGSGKQTLTSVADVMRVPVIGMASAGAPVNDEEDERIIGWEYPTADEYRPHMLVLQVDGESMNNGDAKGMQHGDRLYIDPRELELHEGRIYVVHVHGNGIVVKRARKLGSDWWLFSDNKDFAPTKPDQATIIGRVFFHQPRGMRL
ncbi:LexA family transcriptional regulator [Deinococcus sp. KSM4-11]|uniref:LexA family transcriptional regulator n=1 Tax=Deinococcus sp. KSM4-11 TaxID=2568654 RepID=UPI001454D93D|nr:LexA family transcriptional regulator [Deinococcus sp. KSM4-11]